MSLRARLLIAVAAVALVALVVADVITYRSLKSFLYDRVDQSLESARAPLSSRFGGGDFDHRPPPGNFGGADLEAPGTYVELRSTDGQVIASTPARERGGQSYTPSLPSNLTANPPASGQSSTFFDTHSTEAGGPPFRVRVSTLGNGTVLVVGVPIDDTVETLHRLLLIELLVTAAALVAAMGLGWWLVRVGLKPLDDVETTADAIAAGDLDRRVPGDEKPTEVGRLARALNVMLGRIQQAFAQRDATEAELRASEARMRRFVGDASHELRTPLAAVSAYAELFERGADQRPEDLARVMSGIRTETGRMSELVEDLLLLARLDEGRPLQRTRVELVALAAQAVDAARAVSSEWPIHLDAIGSVEVSGDAGRLRQVFDNLVANVRAHTPPGTTTTLRVRAEDSDAVITVADDGPGLTDEEAGRVFERFYRAEASRTRQHGGGAGLGLAIVAAIAHAHGGDATAMAHGSEGGAVFRVCIPLASDDPATWSDISGESQPAHS